MRTIRDKGTLQAVPKPVAPQKREKHLELVRSRPCCVCSSPAPSDAHHYGRRGVGQKADDWQTVPLCRRCHDGWHAQGYCPPYNREETIETFLRSQVALLMEALSLAVDDSTQSCSSCAETARERDEARTQRDEEKQLREDAVGRYHLINESMLQAHERVDRIAEAIGCLVHNRHGDDVDREVVVEAARRLVAERQQAIDAALSTSDACWRMEQEVLQRQLDEARAEVAHEREVANEHVAQRHDAERERDEARAELQRLRHELRQLRARLVECLPWVGFIPYSNTHLFSEMILARELAEDTLKEVKP